MEHLENEIKFQSWIVYLALMVPIYLCKFICPSN